MEKAKGLFNEDKEIGVLKLRKRVWSFELLKGVGLKLGTIEDAFSAEFPKLSNFKNTVIRFFDNSKLRINPFIFRNFTKVAAFLDRLKETEFSLRSIAFFIVFI